IPMLSWLYAFARTQPGRERHALEKASRALLSLCSLCDALCLETVSLTEPSAMSSGVAAALASSIVQLYSLFRALFTRALRHGNRRQLFELMTSDLTSAVGTALYQTCVVTRHASDLAYRHLRVIKAQAERTDEETDELDVQVDAFTDGIYAQTQAHAHTALSALFSLTDTCEIPITFDFESKRKGAKATETAEGEAETEVDEAPVKTVQPYFHTSDKFIRMEATFKGLLKTYLVCLLGYMNPAINQRLSSALGPYLLHDANHMILSHLAAKKEIGDAKALARVIKKRSPDELWKELVPAMKQMLQRVTEAHAIDTPLSRLVSPPLCLSLCTYSP
ncbi:hypothetical protein KIPB_010477, partial [Kipferlia bialata]